MQRVRQAGRVMTHTLNTVATLGCLDRLTKREPPRLHLEATFYKTGAEEIQAVSQGASAEEVMPSYCCSQEVDLLNMSSSNIRQPV